MKKLLSLMGNNVMVNQMRCCLMRMLSHAHAHAHHESITLTVSGQGNQTGEFLQFVFLAIRNYLICRYSSFSLPTHHLFNNNFIQNFYYFNFMFTTLSLILNSYLWVKCMYARPARVNLYTIYSVYIFL